MRGRARGVKIEPGKLMKLHEVMTTSVEVVDPEASIVDAARKMRNENVGGLPVCDGRKLLGMITDRDITIRVIADGQDPKTTKVRECMSADLIYCFEDQTDSDAARLMEQKQIRRIPVISREKELVGIVALGDLAKRSHIPEEVGDTLKKISMPPAGR